jgi:hypothetical protein
MDKRPLISESVTVTQIDIHFAGEEPDQHVVRTTPGVSHTTTVCEVPTNSKSDPCSRDEVLSLTNAWLGCHPGLPHSPSNNHLEAGRCGLMK